MNYLQSHIEAIIFSAHQPVKVEEIQKCLQELLGAEVSKEEVLAAIHTLMQKYSKNDFAFDIFASGAGYQFLTKPEYEKTVNILLNRNARRGLSKSALETLAIIAYKQPITKTQIEQIRGVGADYAIQKLLEKELIVIKGKASTVGKPVLYATSDKFMHYFGIRSMEDLPLPEDLENVAVNTTSFEPTAKQDTLY